MSHQREEMSDEKESRVKLNDLPRKEEALKDKEARQVQGGGGALGGVVNTRQGANDPRLN